MKLRRGGIYIILSVGACLVGILLTQFGATSPEDPYYHLASAMPRSFDINVKTVGVLDAVRSHTVSSTVKGEKGKIIYLIKDGDRVKKGDILIKLDPTPFEEEIQRLTGKVQSFESAVDATQQLLDWEKNQVERELKTAQFNIQVAQLDLRKLVKGDGPLQMAQFKEEIKKAEEELSRYLSYIAELQRLQKSGVDNPTEMNLAVAKTRELQEKYASANDKFLSYKKHVFPSLVETAKAKLEKAKMELEQTRKGSVFKVARAVSQHNEVKGKLELANAALKGARQELQKTTIVAPFAGIAILYEAFRGVRKRKPRVGDRVWQNQPLLYLPDISSMIVKAQIREIDLHKIAIGQGCRVQVDAYPGVLFDGELTFIGVLAEEKIEFGGGEKYFQMTVLIKSQDSRLRPGMTARVTTLAGEVLNALCVPIQAIFGEGGTEFCYRFSGDKFQKVKVSAARQNENMVEIVSGLKQGDKVSLVRPPREKISVSVTGTK